MGDSTTLPWKKGDRPLMLAPMQGITNRALRGLFVERYAPDIVFTEFVRVRPGAKKTVSKNDCLEVSTRSKDIPLVVQLIGGDSSTLVEAAKTVQDLGAGHININLGCPYGRMGRNAAGGNLLRDKTRLAKILSALRSNILGSFSVKVRSGIEDSLEFLSLLDLFESCGVDFIIVHPRTVQQKYGGTADHQITAAAVQHTSLPVIANGDIFTKVYAEQVLEQTCSAGLMLGRGAIGDPFLFERIRGRYDAVSSPERRREEFKGYLLELLERYNEIFSGEHQVLCKMKEIVNQVKDPECTTFAKKLLRSKRLDRFVEVCDSFG